MRHLPVWFTKKVHYNANTRMVEDVLRGKRIDTICVSGICPNRGECFSKKTAAFLILGDVCTRQCRFCGVTKGQPDHQPGITDVESIVEAVYRMDLRYVVITSVTRDDLQDGGAGLFYDMILALKRRFGHIPVEVLIPDFNGNTGSLRRVLEASPAVLNHNIETVQRLYPTVRPGADYNRSLGILKEAGRSPHTVVKSGLILGMGETNKEVYLTLEDLRHAGCGIVTIGQYLPPSKEHMPVTRYVRPEEFDEIKQYAHALGFRSVAAGPFVRSSYRAGESYTQVKGYS